MKARYFAIVLQSCFLFNDKQSQNQAPRFTVTSHSKREPSGDKAHNVRVTIFLKVFFYYSKKSKHVFSSWITTILYEQHMQLNELCAMWVITEESLKQYPERVLVPFPADRKGGIFDFTLNWTPPNQDTEQRFYLMYLFNPLFIHWYLFHFNASFWYLLLHDSNDHVQRKRTSGTGSYDIITSHITSQDLYNISSVIV